MALGALPARLAAARSWRRARAFGSGSALGVVAEFGLPYQVQPYHGHVFRLGDLADLVERYGVPDAPADADYDGYEQREMEKYIEVQVWTDDVLSLAALTSTSR
jgi:hypothetical protein